MLKVTKYMKVILKMVLEEEKEQFMTKITINYLKVIEKMI